MASYAIEFRRSAQRDLRSISSTNLSRILAAIEALGQDPLPRQAGKLVGAERTYRLRVGNYRVIYDLDAAGERVTVHYVRHRREVYRAL